MLAKFFIGFFRSLCRSVLINCKRVLVSTASEDRMIEVNVVVIIFFTHPEVHENVKDYKCDSCDKSFTWKSQLEFHTKKIHMNMKPYQCVCCDKRFAVKNMMELHLQIVHGNIRTYNCDICNRSFGKKNQLENHLKKNHWNKFQDNYKKIMFDFCIFGLLFIFLDEKNTQMPKIRPFHQTFVIQ